MKNIKILEKQLLDKYSRLELAQEEHNKILIETEAYEKTLEEDFEQAEIYRDKFIEIMGKIETVINKIPVQRDDE